MNDIWPLSWLRNRFNYHCRPSFARSLAIMVAVCDVGSTARTRIHLMLLPYAWYTASLL